MNNKNKLRELQQKYEQGKGFYCDCVESSKALGYPNVKGWHDEDCDFHVMTKTITFKDDKCKYCGHYAMWRNQ